jgi:transcription initiation factor TFIID TATA-box-binding protein
MEKDGQGERDGPEGSDDSQLTVQTENVVATTSVEQEIDLQRLAMSFEGSDYDPEIFQGIVFSPNGAAATMLIFRSGKVVGTGAASVSDAHESLHLVFDRLRDLGIDVDDSPDITVTNIVATADLGEELNLAGLAIGLGLETTEYEPEQFPGLIYRPDDSGVVILTFGTGKLVINGARKLAEAEQAFASYLSKLDEIGLREMD